MSDPTGHEVQPPVFGTRHCTLGHSVSIVVQRIVESGEYEVEFGFSGLVEDIGGEPGVAKFLHDEMKKLGWLGSYFNTTRQDRTEVTVTYAGPLAKVLATSSVISGQFRNQAERIFRDYLQQRRLPTGAGQLVVTIGTTIPYTHFS